MTADYLTCLKDSRGIYYSIALFIPGNRPGFRFEQSSYLINSRQKLYNSPVTADRKVNRSKSAKRRAKEAGNLAENVVTQEAGVERVRWRRIILPVVMVLGVFFCGYASLFVGVKEDLPAPPNAARFPLSLSNQSTVRGQFAEETKNLKTLDISVYVLRDNPQEAANYWRGAFVDKRNWKELTPPQPPKDGGTVNFTTLAFNRSASKVILAIASADQLLSLDNEFTRALAAANYRPGDTVAIMLAGDIQ